VGVNGTVHQLFIDFKKMYDSVRRKVLYNILTEFGITWKLAGLIKMCLNETYSRVHTGKSLSGKFTVQNGVEKEMLYHHYFSTFLWNMPSGGSKRNRKD
jgi:hypothetical protein